MAEARPYKPSWIDRLLNWIDSLPFPPLVFFVLLCVLYVLVMHLSLWLEGYLPWGAFHPTFIFDSIWIPYGLGYIYFMDRAAVRSIHQFRPLLEVADAEFETIAYRFTTLPARATLVLSILGVSMGLESALSTNFPFLGPGGFSFTFLLWAGFFALGSIAFPVLVFGGFRLLYQIDQLFRRVQKVNLFHLQPMYGLAGVAMVVSGYFIIGANLNAIAELYLGTANSAADTALRDSAIIFVIALTLVILPLSGIRRKIDEAKRSFLADLGVQIEGLSRDLQSEIGERKFENVQGFERSLAALFNLRTQVQAIPAWPWQPGAFRNFLSAIGLPLLIWLAQRVLSQYF